MTRRFGFRAGFRLGALTSIALVAGCNLLGDLPDLEPAPTGGSTSSGNSSSSASGTGGGGGSPNLPFCDAPDRFNGDLSAWDALSGTPSIVGISGNPALRLDAPGNSAELRRAALPVFEDCAGSVALLESDGQAFLTFFDSDINYVEVQVTSGGVLVLNVPPSTQSPFPNAVATHVGYAIRKGLFYVGYRDAAGWHLVNLGAKASLLEKAITYAIGVRGVNTHALFDDYNVEPIAFTDLDAATN